MPRHHRPVNIQKIHRWLLEIQNTQKEHFDWAHRAKDKRVLKVKEHVRFFLQKQYSAKPKWLTGTVIEILERGCSYIIEGPNGKKYRRNRAHLKPLCHDRSSFQDPPKAKKQNPTRCDNVDSFQDPRPKPIKRVTFQDWTTVVPLFKYTAETGETSNTKSTSHSSHCVHSPHSPSSSPPAQLSPREHLVSPNPEDYTASKQQTIIWPQDVDTQLTPGLAALIKETSPLAPYKIQHSAKRRARQMLRNIR